MPVSNPRWRRLQSLTSARYRRPIVIALLITGMLVSGLSALTVEQLEATRRRELVDNNAAIVRSRVEQMTSRAVDALESVRPLWTITPDASDAQFKDYLRHGLADEQDGRIQYAGLSDVALIRAVEADEVGDFVRSIRAERPQRYDIDLDEDGPHYVIDFHSSDTILGIDLYPLDNRRVALEAARDSGHAVATEWYATVADRDLPADQQRKITLIAVPVYEGTGIPPSIDARRRRLIGWLATPMFADAVVERASKDLPIPLALLAGDSTNSEPVAAVGPEDPALRTTTTLDILGRPWTFAVGAPEDATGRTAFGSVAVFTAGLLFTLLITTLFWLTSRLGDQSERRASTATARLRERENYLRVIAEHVTVGIADLDTDGRIIWANHQVAELLHVESGEVISASWLDHVHPDDRDGVRAAQAAAVHTGKPFEVRHRLAIDGEERWVEKAGVPIVNEDGDVGRIVAVVTDVSAMVEFEAQLRTARDRALRASRLKSEFLANMSHEIRTPLNGVIGMADVLYRTGLSDSQRSKVSTLRTAATQLQDLLNDILDLSKIEAGRLAIERVDFNLTETIAGIVQLHASEAFNKGLHLRIDIDADLPSVVTGSQLRLRQVLNNLLGNAVKFTEHGAVRLTVCAVGTDRDLIRVRFDVSDTGIGIPAGTIDTIFDPFTQADASDTRSYGGTGLGLAISRQLVEMLGGDLTVESVVEEGSRFAFVLTFPVVDWTPSGATVDARSRTASSDASDTPAPDPAPGETEAATVATEAAPDDDGEPAAGRLLVVEDNPINQEVACELLSSLGYEVVMADDGAKAVDAVMTSEHDAILMDCQMPGMDGYEATARIRSFEETLGRRTPIIAMTASAMVGDRQRCLAAGMDDYIAKPVSVTILTETLDRWVDVVSPAEDRAASRRRLPDDTTELPPVIDWQILHQLSVVPGLLERARGKFLENGQHELAEMRQLAADGDFAQLGAVAHKLKGASLTIGAARLGALLQQVEQASDEAPDTVVETFDRLDRCFEDVREALLATERV